MPLARKEVIDNGGTIAGVGWGLAILIYWHVGVSGMRVSFSKKSWKLQPCGNFYNISVYKVKTIYDFFWIQDFLCPKNSENPENSLSLLSECTEDLYLTNIYSKTTQARCGPVTNICPCDPQACRCIQGEIIHRHDADQETEILRIFQRAIIITRWQENGR